MVATINTSLYRLNKTCLLGIPFRIKFVLCYILHVYNLIVKLTAACRCLLCSYFSPVFLYCLLRLKMSPVSTKVSCICWCVVDFSGPEKGSQPRSVLRFWMAFSTTGRSCGTDDKVLAAKNEFPAQTV